MLYMRMEIPVYVLNILNYITRYDNIYVYEYRCTEKSVLYTSPNFTYVINCYNNKFLQEHYFSVLTFYEKQQKSRFLINYCILLFCTQHFSYV
jgi:hypothetical protein